MTTRRTPPLRPPAVHVYVLADGWQVLAGRSDSANDRLSLEVARPSDWWFHARGVPGSHVLLRGPEGAEADRGLLKTAAAVAAYHSKARGLAKVTVTCTRAANVSKPHRAPAGTVQVRRETTLKVRPALPPQERLTAANQQRAEKMPP